MDKNHLIAILKLHSATDPVTSKYIEENFRVTGPELRAIIRELRRSGHPIANSPYGYFYAKTYSEIQPTIQDLEARSLSMLETVKRLKSRFFPAAQKQETLFDN